MKRLIAIMIVAGLMGQGAAYAADLAAKKALLASEARAKLKSQEWTVFVVKDAPGPRIMETDVLTFGDGTVSTKNMLSLGYGESNFGLTIQDDGTATWETMKKTKDGDVAFLRADVVGTVMKGAISIKPPEGEMIVYAFSNIKEQLTQAIAASPAASAQASVATTTTSTTRKVTKK